MNHVVNVEDVLKLAGKVYRHCRDCTGEYKHLTAEARSLSNVLEDLQDKYNKIPHNKQQQVRDAITPCIEVLQELERVLVHYNSLGTKSKRTWDRFNWSPNEYTALQSGLTSSVSTLEAFYTTLNNDSQVLILEGLARLEDDYKGGYREESIASIETLTVPEKDGGDDDDAAWTQILRDLEDVGIARQDALQYRDMIIEWLITAVNEGRLLEQQPQNRGLTSMQYDLESALPGVEEANSSGDKHLHVPTMLEPTSGNNSVALRQSDESKKQLSQISRWSPGPTHTRDVQNLERPPMPGAPRASDTTTIPRRPQSASYAGLIPVEQVSTPPHIAPYAPQPVHATFPTSSLPEVSPISSLPIAGQPPPHNGEDKMVVIDLSTNAQQIIASWRQQDFSSAQRLLEEQLAAVERGQTVVETGLQPDRRVLQFLIGVCASYSGDFKTAKRAFESIANRVSLTLENLGNIDEGDIAAARWLGDVCLQLRKYYNCVLAWSVASSGSVSRYGLTEDRTRGLMNELRVVDHWLFAFERVEKSMLDNIDPTNILSSTTAVEKFKLLAAMRTQLNEGWTYRGREYTPPRGYFFRPFYLIPARWKPEALVTKSFLLGPLISLSAWPLPWDATFSPMDTVQLERNMNTVPNLHFRAPLVERNLPNAALGESKKLHYVTKKRYKWLIEAVQSALRLMGIEYGEHATDVAIICRLDQQMAGYAFTEGVEIHFKKLQFRNIYGLKVTAVKYATRTIGLKNLRYRDDFIDVLTAILEQAERGEEDLSPVAMQAFSTNCDASPAELH